MNTEPTYNVYEICMGALEWEESFDDFDSAHAAFVTRAEYIVRDNLNDYGPEEGDGLYFYDVSLGSMIDDWQYAN
jgi:hypothetical protein